MFQKDTASCCYWPCLDDAFFLQPATGTWKGKSSFCYRVHFEEGHGNKAAMTAVVGSGNITCARLQ